MEEQMVAGKVVMVTGGSAGFGKAAAKLFAENGAKVIIASRTEDALRQAKSETGCDAYYQMDVTNPVDWQNARAFLLGRYGRIDVLINNAGGAVSIREITEQKVPDIEAGIALNLTSAIYGAQAFARVMKAQEEGTIINVASACAKHAWPGWSVYAAAKWGMLGFSKNLYVDLRPYNIRVTCIVPGAGDTDFMNHAGGKKIYSKLKASDVAQVMLNVCSLPQEIVVEEIVLWGNDQAVVPL
jgi:NADP-dependent 3-hydroxy acid dehydrogenase YdfG